jgi:small subunit ribosomal protein S4
MKLYLKGERCYKEKCSMERSTRKQSQRGAVQKKLSDYCVQLREKQKVKRIYGILEAQFRRYFYKASRSTGITGEILLQLLERRLDNVVYRAGFASSRKEARQIVRHNHIVVNGKKVNIPSFTVKPGQIVSVVDSSKQIPSIVNALGTSEGRGVPEWITVDKQVFRAEILKIPERSDVKYEVQESLIVELYSK